VKVSEQGKEEFLDDLSQVKAGTVLVFWTAAELKSDETKKQVTIKARPQQNVASKPVAITLPGRKGKPLCYSARLNAHDGLPPLARYCIDYLRKYGLQSEGIFRVSGTEAGMNEVRKLFEDPGNVQLNLADAKDVTEMVPNVAGAFKKYFRTLAEPVVPFNAYDAFLAVDDGTTVVTPLKCRALRQAIRTLPKVNQIALREICSLCKAVADQSEINLMTSANSATIFSPSLLEYPQNEGSPEKIKEELARRARVIQVLIDGYSPIFERLESIEKASLNCIKKVNAMLRNRQILNKTDNHSSLPKFFENLQEEILPAVFGALVPKLGESLSHWAAPKPRTFEELRKLSTSDIADVDRVNMHNLRVEANDVSLVADVIKTAGFTRAISELDEMFEMAGKALNMLSNWVVYVAQGIFLRGCFTQEWCTNKFATKPVIEQLQQLIEDNVRPLKSEGHRGIVLEHVTRGILGQYCLVFAAKAQALRNLKIDEQQLRIRLKQDEELLVTMLSVVLRLAQPRANELNQEVSGVLSSIPMLFCPELKELSAAVKTIAKYIGPQDAHAAVSELLALRSQRKHEEIVLPTLKVHEKLRDKEKPHQKKSHWLLDLQIQNVTIFDATERKRCDVTLSFKSGTTVIETTLLKDVLAQQASCASAQLPFDSVSFEVRVGLFKSKLVGTAQLMQMLFDKN